MKKKIFKIAAVLMSAVAICTVFSISIITHSQGDDPLVTLSYLTEIILPQMKQDIMAEVEKLGIKIESDVVTDMPEETTDVQDAETDNTTAADDEANTDAENEDKTDADVEDKTEDVVEKSEQNTSSYTLLELTKGQCVYADSVVEMIVRSGSDVRAISPFDSQGIADITFGTEYLNGDMLSINSYCIIPRGGDGRGIEVYNEKSYILVRGEYHIG